jgi:hypothetical protein
MLFTFPVVMHLPVDFLMRYGTLLKFVGMSNDCFAALDNYKLT